MVENPQQRLLALAAGLPEAAGAGAVPNMGCQGGMRYLYVYLFIYLLELTCNVCI